MCSSCDVQYCSVRLLATLPPPHVSDILTASTGLSVCSSCDVQYCSVRLLATLPSSTCQRYTGSLNRFVYVFFLRCPVLFCPSVDDTALLHMSVIYWQPQQLYLCSSCDVQYCSVRLLATLPSSTCQRYTGSLNRFVYVFFLRCPVLFCPSVDGTALLHMSVIYWQPQQVCLCVLPAMSSTVLFVCWRHCPPPHVSDILAASTGLSVCSSCDVQYCSVRLLATLPPSTCP